MNQSPPPPIAEVHRRLIREHEFIVATGDFHQLFEGYLAHVRRWELPTEPLTDVMMRQALGGAALQLSYMPVNENKGWTIHIAKPLLNVFVAGNNTDRKLAGRAFTEGIQATGQSRMYVQSKRGQHEPVTSSLEVNGLDILVIYEQYFQRSIQIPARFLELSDFEMVMIQGLPGADAGQIAALNREEIPELLEKHSEEVDTRIYEFGCECTGERIARAMATFFAKREEDLFQGDPGVEALCPRCGARWWIEREFYEKTIEEMADEWTQPPGPA